VRLHVLVIAIAACSSSSHSQQYDRALALLARADGTSVFGPNNEFLASDLPEVGDTGLYAARPPSQCDVAVLPGGEDSFAARMALLAAANKTIRIQALIFTADESGLRVAEVLKQKKAAGVDVKVIVDGVNNPSLQTQWMYFDLKQQGIEVEGYEALGLQIANEIPIPLLTPHYDALAPNLRYHEKLWIIDAGTPDARAVMGGLNIANEYFRVDPSDLPHYWRDQDVSLRGAIIEDLTTAFDTNFEFFKAEKRRRGGLTDKAWEATRAILDKTGKPEIAFKVADARVQMVAALEARPVPAKLEPSFCRFFHSRPRLHETYIQQAYLKLLASAKREVLIANAYFVPTIATRMALLKAARRCVKITILTNGAELSDTPGMSLLGRGHYAELLAVNRDLRCPAGGGIEIWEWLGKERGAAQQTQGMWHAKFAVVDRKLALVGSFNLDARSERLNSETAIVFENPGLAEQLARTLVDRDLASSRQISNQEAAGFEKPKSVFEKVKKDLAGLVLEDLL
jgi:cardiolipin synthase C